MKSAKLQLKVQNNSYNSMKNIKYQISNDGSSSRAETQTFSIFYLLFVVQHGALS